MAASWSRLDSRYFKNPKVRAMGVDGRALDLAGICYCAREETDGKVSRSALKVIAEEAGIRPGTVKKCVEFGRWEVTETGWLIHDFLDYNRSADDIRKERNRWQQNKRRQRSAVDNDVDVPDFVPGGQDEMSTPLSPPLRNGTEEEPTVDNNFHPSHGSPTDEEVDKAKAVARRYAELAWQQAHQPSIANPSALKNAKYRKALDHPDLLRLLRDYPTAPDDVIAAALNGETHSLRYFTEAAS